MGVLFYELKEVPGNTNDYQNSKNAQQEFSTFAWQHPAERHAWIFYKLKIEPTRNYLFAFTVVEVQLYPNLDPLVESQYRQYGDQGFFQNGYL